MATAYTSLLGLALPVTGELSGTWGNTVNTEITQLLDSAISGTTTISTDADVTLTTTTGAANTSRQAVILWTAGGTVTRNITAPAQSKTYVVINKTSSTQSIVLRGVGPTTGVTIALNEKAVCAWNGVDFVKVSSSSGDVAGPGSATDNAITRFDGTTGKIVQNSSVTVADDGAIVAPQVGSIIPFYFANQAAFPSASTYHGALAHSHADGAMYFAHGGVWAKLVDVISASTFTGLQTFSGTSSNASHKATNMLEVATVSATAATGTINFDNTTQSVLYYTSNATGNWTLNFRGSSGTSLNSVMSTGESISATFLVTQGSTAYYNSAVTVDGSSVTPKYQGGTAYTSGNASSIDSYTYVIIKTGSAAFTVLASQTKFA